MRTKFRRDANVLMAAAIANAALVVEPNDPHDLEAFAAELCGLEGLNLDTLRQRLSAVCIFRGISGVFAFTT